ncbi:MAG: hypothetical protein U0441_38605 [Polyangiaceae bacterium]
MFEIVRRCLSEAGITHLVFGSAAGAVYGWSRAPADIDVLVQSDSLAPIRARLPDATPIASNGLLLGEVEIWLAPIVLRFEERACTLPFDDETLEHSVRHAVFGRVLGPEDQLLIKAALQRSGHGKVDVEDARALVRYWGARLDHAYLARRAARCGLTDRLLPFVPELPR